MQIVDIDKLMRDKLNECGEWLVGKDNAILALEEARIAYEKAQAQVAEYTDENILRVIEYRDELKLRLGIVDDEMKVRLGIVDRVEEVAEVHDEQVIGQSEVAEVGSDEIVEHLLV